MTYFEALHKYINLITNGGSIKEHKNLYEELGKMKDDDHFSEDRRYEMAVMQRKIGSIIC